MYRKPVFTFHTTASIGVDKIPVDGNVQISDDSNPSDGTGALRLINVHDISGLGATTTVQDLLELPLQWTEIGAGEQGGVAWIVEQGYKIGDIVTIDNVAYICDTDHTSVTGDAANGSPLQPLQTNWEIVNEEVGGTAYAITTEYTNGDMVVDDSVTPRVVYVSLVDANTGNALTDTAFWQEIDSQMYNAVTGGDLNGDGVLDATDGTVVGDGGGQHCPWDSVGGVAGTPGAPATGSNTLGEYPDTTIGPDTIGAIWYVSGLGLDADGDSVTYAMTGGSLIGIEVADGDTFTWVDGVNPTEIWLHTRAPRISGERGGIAYRSGEGYLIGDITVFDDAAYLALTGTNATPNTGNQPDTSVTDWQEITVAERAGLLWRSTEDYLVGDVVTESGSGYVCVRDNTSSAIDDIDGSPTQPLQTAWDLIANRERGGVSWAPEVDYIAGDIVLSDAAGPGLWESYYCIVSHTSSVAGDTPLDTNTDWELFTTVERGGVSWTADRAYVAGDIVYDIVDDTPYVALGTIIDLATNPADNIVEWKAITGTSGSMLTADYRFDTAIAGDPGSGRVSVNNADNTLADVIFISMLDEDGNDRTYGLDVLTTGDYVSFREHGNNPEAYTYRLLADGINQTTYFEFSVVHYSSTSTGGLSNNERISTEVLYIPKRTPDEKGGISWAVDIEYVPGDIIMSDHAGPGMWEQYYCTTTHTSSASFPTDISNWNIIAVSTEVGGRAFDVANNYEIGDIVVENGDTYQVISAHPAGAWDPLNFELLLKWSGLFNDTLTYQKNEMVRDGSWTGIANKETDDRVAPQEKGAVQESITVDAFTDEIDASVVSMVHSHTMTQDGYVTELQVQLPEYTVDTTTKVTVTNQRTLQTEIFHDVVVSPANSWVSIGIDNSIALNGDVIDVKFDVHNSDTASEFALQSRGNEGTGVPATQEINIDDMSAPIVIEIDHTGLSGTDFQVELDAASVGSIMTIIEAGDTSRNFILEVTAIDTTSATSTAYTVIVLSTDRDLRDNRDLSIKISDPIAVDTHYSLNAGLFATNPTYCTVQTTLAFGGVDQAAPITDGYGINLLFQEASISPDWDLIAISGGTSGGGSASFIGLSDTPVDYAGNTGMIPVVNAAETALEFIDIPLTTTEHDAAATYAIDQQMYIADPERATFVTRYENNTGAEIAPEVFDPTKWDAMDSTYQSPWGLEFTQTGLISGGNITAGTAANEIDIAAGEAVIVDKTTGGSTEAPLITRVSWLDTTIVLGALGTDRQYEVYIDTAGVPQVTIPPIAQEFYRANIRLGYVASAPTAPGDVSLVQYKPLTIQSMADSVAGLHVFFFKTQIVRGGAATPASLLQFNVDNGSIYGYNVNYSTNPDTPHILALPGQTNVNFTYADSLGNFLAAGQDIIPGSYEDIGTPGTITAMDGVTQIATIQLLYWSEPYSGYFVMYGQETYPSLQTAIDQRENYSGKVQQPTEMMYGAVFVGYIIVVHDATDLSLPDEAIILNASGASITGAGTNVEELDGLIDVVAPTPTTGDILEYNAGSGTWINVPSPAIAANNNRLSFSQTAHALAIGDAVTVDAAGNWVLASATDRTRLPAGIVEEVAGVDDLTVLTAGFISLPAHGLQVGEEHYLDPLNLGQSVDTVPTTPGQWKCETFMPINADTAIIGAWVAVEI